MQDKYVEMLLGVFTPQGRNRRYCRLIYEYLPGTRFVDITSAEAAVIMVNGTSLIKQLHTYGNNPLTSQTADLAAKHGKLEIIHVLRELNIHCTFTGANWAATNGYLHVIHDLRSEGIECTRNGANFAARSGHIDVVRDLRKYRIHCTTAAVDFVYVKNDMVMFEELNKDPNVFK